MKELQDELDNSQALLTNERDNVKRLKAERAELTLKNEELSKKLLSSDDPTPAPVVNDGIPK